MENKAKTLREVRNFLNKVEDEFLDRTFILQQENDVHYVHFLDLADEDMLHDPDDLEQGNMIIADWKEYSEETDLKKLIVGIPKGAPMIGEDF